MRDSKSVSIYAISALVLFVLIVLFLAISNYIYAIIGGVLLIFDLILFIIYMNSTKSDKDRYQSDLKYILKTFDSILAYLDCDLDFTDKEVVKLDQFDDLVNCQEEIKKPILYKYDDSAALFVLLDKDIIYYTFLKESESSVNVFEEKINSDLSKKKKDVEPDETILDGVDKTMIIQTKGKKRYKVSPVRSEEAKEELLNLTKTIQLPKLKIR